jgi:hypothetical protein
LVEGVAVKDVLSSIRLARILSILRSHNRVLWPAVAMTVALVVFLSTLQTIPNGSGHPYATDVGEIQNALPRWGLIHRSGYPLYTATGSLFVTLLRLVGIEPAAGASLFSAVWGVVTVGLLVVLAEELGASGPAATLGALTTALAISVWVDASLAEVHTLTLAFTVATLLLAVRFGRTGKRCDLLLLTLAFTQGVVHQRTVALVALAVAVLVWPQLRVLWRGLGSVVAVGLLAPLTYLYMPLRVWTGATWVFGSPGTWEGFWEMVFDNRAERVIRWSASPDAWLSRIGVTMQLLSDDMLWPLLVLGLVGLALLVLKGRGRESLSMTLAWAPNVLLALIIWKNRVGDAQLAAKLPVLTLAGIGWALILEWLRQRSRPIGSAAAIALTLTLVAWGWRVRPFVLSITRDPYAETIIATADRIVPPPDGRQTTLVALWGHAYWALAYAQECRGQLSDINLVDHNADFRSIANDGDHLLAMGGTFRVLPVSWWEDRLGRLYLASAASDVVEMSPTPPVNASDVPEEVAFDLENGLRIRSAALAWGDVPGELLLTVYWEAVQPVTEDYCVAVHLVSHNPPRDGGDVLAQADSHNPVGGWYPTSRWEVGEVVRDNYVLPVPQGSCPVVVRVAMYQVGESGAFINTSWLSLSVPQSAP